MNEKYVPIRHACALPTAANFFVASFVGNTLPAQRALAITANVDILIVKSPNKIVKIPNRCA
jgi:hypothetical protein